MFSEMQIKSVSYFPTSDLWNKYYGRTTSLEMDTFFPFSFDYYGFVQKKKLSVLTSQHFPFSV